jgi:hypothetical protein
MLYFAAIASDVFDGPQIFCGCSTAPEKHSFASDETKAPVVI